MPDEVEPPHVAHADKKISYHIEWELRREAAIWDGNRIIRPNMYPLGAELRKWMKQEPWLLPILDVADPTFTNPYTRDASVLIKTYRDITNDLLGEPPATPNVLDTQLRYVRLYTEFVLYTARICEALIKQMLFCTGFPDGYYKGAALGKLLSQECKGCRASRNEKHKLSMLGSVAHHYRLCLGYEKCLEQLLPMAARLRDVEAAHSGTRGFDFKRGTETIEGLRRDAAKLGEDFIHMLEHIGEIEMAMHADISSDVPPKTTSV